MYHNRLQQFECDECRHLVEKKKPVIYEKGRHFCSPICFNQWLDRFTEGQNTRPGDVYDCVNLDYHND